MTLRPCGNSKTCSPIHLKIPNKIKTIISIKKVSEKNHLFIYPLQNIQMVTQLNKKQKRTQAYTLDISPFIWELSLLCWISIVDTSRKQYFLFNKYKKNTTIILVIFSTRQVFLKYSSYQWSVSEPKNEKNYTKTE